MTIDQLRQATVLSVEEAGQALGIGRSLAYAMSRDGRLPGVIRLGRKVVVSAPKLLALLEQNSAGPEGVGPALDPRGHNSHEHRTPRP